jgi:hypothetical protein
MIKKYLIGSSLAVAALVGCGSTSTDSVVDTTTATSTAYLVDSAVSNVDYDCITDGVNDKVTGADGSFTCQNMHQIRFRLGNLVLGEIDAVPQDGYVFPQDIAGVPRSDVMNAKVTAMAQLLQSLDEDGDLNNGIQITDSVKQALEAEDFTAENLLVYAENTIINQIRTETQSQEHLRATMQELLQNNQGENGVDLSSYPLSNLTNDQKYTIAFMWNEEKLAKDIYLELNLIYPTQQLEKIATQSETKHQALVEELVQRYDLNITNLVDYKENYSEAELRAFASGEFGVQEIQDLYDTLYAEGSQSQQAALEVGCKVEVTDVEDLLDEIKIAEEVNAQDLIAVWDVLLSGSYNHYWAFDKGLKNKGIAEGCCSLGTAYCHPEYPQNENGKH